MGSACGKGGCWGRAVGKAASHEYWLQIDQVRASKDEGQGHEQEEGEEEESERGTVEVELAGLGN